MAQIILAPEDAANGTWKNASFRSLGQNIRDFGYVPDAAQMQPGDVILVAGTNMVAKGIRKTQKIGFHTDDARWTHAALYIGEELIVEATPFGGVRVGSLYKLANGKRLRVRRIPCESGFTMTTRYQVTISALTDLRRGYSLFSIPRLLWWALFGMLYKSDQRPNIGGVIICSSVVRNAYLKSANLNLVPGMISPAWPADLSQTAELTDVQIDWVKIVP